MEPPAVTCAPASSIAASSTNGRAEKRRATTDFLQIDPSHTFSSNNRAYDELPENFLESISPQASTQPVTSMLHEAVSSATSPNLAPLAPMSIAASQTDSYTLLSMPSTPYMSGAAQLIKSEPNHHDNLVLRGGGHEKNSFGNGPAGLLSPLHLDPSNGNRRASTREFSSGIYVKQEESADLDGSHLHHNPSYMTVVSASQQELDRANAETPPAVSNVELASNMIASIIGESPNSPRSYSTPMGGGRLLLVKGDDHSLNGADEERGDGGRYNRNYSSKGRKVYSTKDSSDPLNAEIDDEIYIDTKDLCKRIAYELKQHSIPQAIFAERILCRSQGTLSDLLRNPKPWNKLKSGRETFRRMFNWVQQPLSQRLAILDMYKGEGGEIEVNGRGIMSPPTPAQNVRHTSRARAAAIEGGEQPPITSKRPRLVFTDIQKRTLQAIFKETQRPSREMQQTIAEHLRLDLSTVANFFMNARRRSRAGSSCDEPAPYQQVRPISPPPESPPRVARPPVSAAARRMPASQPHIEDSVASVVEEAYEYSRRLARRQDSQLGTSSEVSDLGGEVEVEHEVIITTDEPSAEESPVDTKTVEYTEEEAPLREAERRATTKEKVQTESE